MSDALSAKLHEISLSCIHCGLCLSECPTYLTLENEMDSPRGRIYLMRALASGELEPSDPVMTHLDLCLDCRGCETVCPSDVRYGELIERTRARLQSLAVKPRQRLSEKLIDLLLYELLPHPGRMRLAMRFARIGAALGVTRLVQRSAMFRRHAPGLAKALEMMPTQVSPDKSPLGFSLPPDATRDRVMFLTGCATAAFAPQTNAAALRVLHRNGCDVNCPQGQGCCGAIHYHGGRVFEARDLARANVDAFEGEQPILSIAAGCGAMMKHYGELLADDPEYADRAKRFVARVRDISEYLVELGPKTPKRRISIHATYHDACHHAHAQGIRREPRELLALIPGLELTECAESDLCCGAAGSYNLTQPEVASELGRRKLANLEATGADVAVTGNVGCILHLQATARQTGSRLRIAHTVDLLDESYDM